MVSIAVLGYGTVGSGVVEVLERNRDMVAKSAGQKISVKYVLARRDLEGRIQELVTGDFENILKDSDVKIVVEVMGGIEPAYTYTKKSLEMGKSVVTSNKELVAAHGAELLAIAAENKVNYFFEGSVGGVIPVIRTMNKSLGLEKIERIYGILNGTTNYILSKMSSDGSDFGEVLAEAQAKGYAESNPAADVEGHDSCRKLAILSSLATGRTVDFQGIYTEGITNITKSDIQFAKAANCAIKLLADAKISGRSVDARVSPALVAVDNPIYMVHDVFNAVFINGAVVDDIMLYGRGAGKLPTAGAVVADVIEAVVNWGHHVNHRWGAELAELVPHGQGKVKKLVRVIYKLRAGLEQTVYEKFGDVDFIELESVPGEIAFITDELVESTIDAKMKELSMEENIESVSGLVFA